MSEKSAWKINGFGGIFIMILLVVLMIYAFSVLSVALSSIIAVIISLAICIMASGLTIVQPNEAKVLTFFGRYVGTILEDGLWLSVPITVRRRVSLKVRNFNSKMLKVNDVDGNPVEIAAVIVFKVISSAKAVFDVMIMKLLSKSKVKQLYGMLLPNIPMTFLKKKGIHCGQCRRSCR
jgi:regulator of protease activity HflC (stomatin/prohibitin superfamily)